MSLAEREALNKLISNADVQQFAVHAENWSSCSTTAVLAASVDKLGKLTEQRAYKDDVGNTRQDWLKRRADLRRCTESLLDAVHQLGSVSYSATLRTGRIFFYFAKGGLPHCQQRCLPLLFLRRGVTKELAPEWSGVVETPQPTRPHAP